MFSKKKIPYVTTFSMLVECKLCNECSIQLPTQSLITSYFNMYITCIIRVSIASLQAWYDHEQIKLTIIVPYNMFTKK